MSKTQLLHGGMGAIVCAAALMASLSFGAVAFAETPQAGVVPGTPLAAGAGQAAEGQEGQEGQAAGAAAAEGQEGAAAADAADPGAVAPDEPVGPDAEVGADAPAEPAAPVPDGWHEGADGQLYWYEGGEPAADKAFYDPGTGAWYWADADGSVARGKDVFIPVSNDDRSAGKWVRFDERGRMVKGEDCRYGGWYYFDEATGEMAKGFRYDPAGSKWVCYDRVTGQMLHGQATDQGSWYYFDDVTGATQYGFRYIPEDSKWVFYDRVTGVMLHGEQAIDGAWYYLDRWTGAVSYGWCSLPDGRSVFYDRTTGQMLHGWQAIDGAWTYLDQYTGQSRFTSDVMHLAWSQIQNMYSETNYLITIDSGNCHVCVFEGCAGNWVPVFDWLCSPGAAATPTVTGEYTIGLRGYSFGSGFTCYYWTQFWGDYLFHTIVYYENTWIPMEGVMGVPASHGCVRLEDQNALWIYNNIPSGTKVFSF